MRRARTCHRLQDGDAEDVAQIALLKAWRAVTDTTRPDITFENDKAITAWMNKILSRTVIDYVRVRGRQRETFFTDLAGFDFEGDDRAAEGLAKAMASDATTSEGHSEGGKGCQLRGATPLRTAGSGPARIDIERAFQGLAPEQNDALRLLAEGYTMDEIGEAQDVPMTTARNRVRRGRELLREALA